MKRPYILSNPWYSTKREHLFSDRANVFKARKYFFDKRPTTLSYLLEKRYGWMNSYIDKEDRGIEIGCGTGLSKLYIKSKEFMITDYVDNAWIDKRVDALDMPFEASSLDYIIASNTLHHLAKPYIFMEEASRVLKGGGRLIIQEANTSLMLRILLRLTNHEGYSYDMDLFNKNTTCNSPDDPWKCNLAIPNLLFDDAERFESNFAFKIIHNHYTECLLWPLSGGIAPVSRRINLPMVILKIVNRFDDLLIAISEDIFALQRQTVLENVKEKHNG